MPHVVIKLYAGRSDQEKQRLADEVAKAVISVLGSSEASVSVGIEDVAPEQWRETVYGPEILGKAGTLWRRPGY